jgi:hypothetical protein
VKAVKELQAPGVQKPPCRAREKRFLGGFLAAPAEMVKIPAGLRTRPTWWQLNRLGGRRPAWPLRLGLVAGRGVHSHARLEAAYVDDLLPLPDLESEGAGSLAEDGVGAIIERVERGDHAATIDPDEAALRKSARSSLSSWRLKFCLGEEKAGASKDLYKIC